MFGENLPKHWSSANPGEVLAEFQNLFLKMFSPGPKVKVNLMEKGISVHILGMRCCHQVEAAGKEYKRR